MSKANLNDWLRVNLDKAETTPSEGVWNALSSQIGAGVAAGSATAAAGSTGASGLATGTWIAASVVAVSIAAASIWYVQQPNTEALNPVVEQIEPTETSTEENAAPVVVSDENLEQEVESETIDITEEQPKVKTKSATAPVANKEESFEELSADLPSETASETPELVTVESNEEASEFTTTSSPEAQEEVVETSASENAESKSPVTPEITPPLASLQMPDIFTPQGSLGSNDIFKPFPASLEHVDRYYIQIYDNQQKLVWSSQNASENWDGTFINGDLAEAGVYFYQVQYFSNAGESQSLAGSVHLKR